MISLPIDEMLLDLRAKLEMFEREGSYAALDEVYRETRRIDCTCEDALEQAPNAYRPHLDQVHAPPNPPTLAAKPITALGVRQYQSLKMGGWNLK